MVTEATKNSCLLAARSSPWTTRASAIVQREPTASRPTPQGTPARKRQVRFPEAAATPWSPRSGSRRVGAPGARRPHPDAPARGGPSPRRSRRTAPGSAPRPERARRRRSRVARSRRRRRTGCPCPASRCCRGPRRPEADHPTRGGAPQGLAPTGRGSRTHCPVPSPRPHVQGHRHRRPSRHRVSSECGTTGTHSRTTFSQGRSPTMT